ncbi:leucine-rich repeat protein [uncultured Eubacterium sp.]|uniref:leucine-rich repeat protein n=1 Tax=uncultured Eubacterium sp. TaxID=165185 RepID=UPI002596AA0F|nr:leucine-rich repeat protein [uncultured Eubacterium sp.]
MTKTNTRNRIVSILLVLTMLLTMVPITGVTASAAEPEWTTVYSYAELQTAVKAKKEYIKLGRNIDTKDFHYSGGGLDIADWLTFENQTCTLDLNGKTLSLLTKIGSMPAFMRVYYGSNLTIKDSQGGGQITGEFENTGAGDRYLIHMNKSSLTLEGGTFRATAKPYGTNVNVIDYLESNVTIKDGVTIRQPEHYQYGGGGSALEGHGYALCEQEREFNYGDEVSHVVIDGGIFDGWVRLIGYQDTNGSVQINGGTFKKGVQALYVAKKNNSDPAVTVNGGTFEDNVYLQDWLWKESLYMPYRLNGGTFKGTVDLHAVNDITVYQKPESNPNVALGLNECFGYSAVVTPDGTFAGPNAYTAVLEKTDDYDYEMWLKGTASNPVRIIPNAWGMKSVTLDGKKIDYAKDWKGTVERMDNSTAHTLKFEWYPLASELVNAGYTYRTKCEHYISGSSAVQQTDTIAADKTSHTVTIPAGADPKVYSYDLQLNLQKDGSSIGIYSNEHIVKLVVSEAPVVEPDPTIEGSVYYTSGIVFGRSISTAASVTPAEATKAYQWQRSTNGGSTWTNIDGATRGSYTPVAADMGENVRIRVKVTAEGYLGEIVGAPVKVSKAANNNYPEAIKLKAVKNGAGNYTGFKITNFDSDCEYVYSTTDTPNWSTNQISSATVTGLTSDTTYYVFARFKETNTHTAGSIVSKNSIRLYDYVPLERVLLEGYGSSGTIYIKKGESVTLKVSADPSNANSWSKITFKDEGATTSNIAISNGNIAASTGTATSFPNGHSITITGVSKGSANLRASYPSATSSAYGTWYVVVYDDSTVANALRLESVYAYEDITLSENDTAELPTNLPKLLPENSGYHLEWRILKRGTYGATYVTENDNIKLEDGKIKPKAAHAGSEKTQLELVAVKDGSDTYRTLPKTSLFYVTVTEAPVIELTGVTVAPTKVNLDLNATYQLSAVKEPVNAAGSLVWESSNPGVATVDSTGKVTAKAQGTAIITVSCGKKKATCTVMVDHQHDYTGQPYLYLDPGNHYQECKAGDGYNIQAHEFTAWTDNGNGTHSRHCTVCKMTDGSTYTETAEHTWVWVVDQEAALNQPGKQHEECTGCHAKRSENTEIPALRDYAVTVTGGTATVAAGTSITRAMEGVEVTVTADAPETGRVFDKWVVKAGGVTLANETSATTTFTMPGNDVKIEATYKDAPPSHSVYVGMTYTAGNFIYQITSIDTATLGQSKVIGVVAAKKNKITKVTIPDRADCKGYGLNVTAVGDKAFKSMKKLKKVTIGNKVTVIGKNAFKKCSKLKTVVIGKAVKTISSKAFIGDNKIKKITFKGKKLKTVNKNAFSKKAKKNIKSKKTKLKGNKKAIKLFKKKLKIK